MLVLGYLVYINIYTVYKKGDTVTLILVYM
jgi:hypothetical protein